MRNMIRHSHDKAFSTENHKKSLERMLHPRHILIIDDINELINKFKLKHVGLTDILTWNDKVKQSEYILQKIEEVYKTAIVDQDWKDIAESMGWDIEVDKND